MIVSYSKKRKNLHKHNIYIWNEINIKLSGNDFKRFYLSYSDDSNRKAFNSCPWLCAEIEKITETNSVLKQIKNKTTKIDYGGWIYPNTIYSIKQISIRNLLMDLSCHIYPLTHYQMHVPRIIKNNNIWRCTPTQVHLFRTISF